VCGIPEPRRSRTYLMALRAFVDESGRPPVFVLGGWLSTIQRWEQFTKEWQQCLDMTPRINGPLKMREAMKLRGSFRGWEKQERDKRLRLFSEIIFAHVELGMFYRVPYDELAALRRDYPAVKKSFGSTYFWAIFGLLSLFMKEQRAVLGITEPVDFVFDENVMEKSAIYEAWSLYSVEWKKHGFTIGSKPSFGDDERLMPLQAAEMIAWQTMVTWDEGGGQSYPFEGTKWRMPKLWGADFAYDDRIQAFVRELWRRRGEAMADFSLGVLWSGE
jgi:hypothetical protein